MTYLQADMVAKLKEMGVTKRFMPYLEHGSGTILLKTKQSPRIIEGWLKGCEIDVYDDSMFRVWTPMVRRARAMAKRHKLRIRLMDGECELFVQASLADELLPRLGAKVKRTLAPEAAKKASEHMSRINSLRFQHARNGVSEALPAFSISR